MDEPSAAKRTRGEELGRLLREDDSAPLWSGEELGAILRHQLAVPLEFGHPQEAETSGPASGLPRPAIGTFGELLADPSPALDLLEKAKAFARQYMDVEGGELPRPVATVIYFASICAALLRHGKRISSLDDAAIRSGTKWALRQEWVEFPVVQVLHAGLRALE